MKSGIYRDLPADQYRGSDGINASSIKRGRKSMLHMRHAMTAAGSKPSPSMRFGTLAHAAILEQSRFAERARVWDGTRRGKAWDEFLSESPDRELVLTVEESNHLSEMHNAIQKKREIVDLLASCEREVSMFWAGSQYGQAKARLDLMAEPMVTGGGIVADYKTCADPSGDAFFRSAYDMGYHIQLGWYALGFEQIYGQLPHVYVIVQQNKSPWDCWLSPVPRQIIEVGMEEAIDIAHRYAICETIGRWPGVAGHDGVIEYRLPAWAGGKTGETEIGSGEEMEASEL